MQLDNCGYRGLGFRIRQLRKEKGLTQEELAEKAKVSVSFIGHIERMEKQPSVLTLIDIAKALEISLDFLILGRRNECDHEDCSLYKELSALLVSHRIGNEIKGEL